MFHPSIEPQSKKTWRLLWDFGDSSLQLEMNDTSDVFHHFNNFGVYTVTLSILDTEQHLVLRKTTFVIVLKDSMIDTNYLYAFKKVTILFRSAREYTSGDLDTTDLIMANNQSINWKGKHFNFYTSKSDYSGTSSGYHSSWNSSYNIDGWVSDNGKQIDSGSYLSIKDEDVFIRTGEGHTHSKASLNFHSLPSTEANQTTLVYSFSGDALTQLISKFEDIKNQSFNLKPSGHSLIKVLWDQQPTPTLIVTFSK